MRNENKAADEEKRVYLLRKGKTVFFATRWLDVSAVEHFLSSACGV